MRSWPVLAVVLVAAMVVATVAQAQPGPDRDRLEFVARDSQRRAEAAHGDAALAYYDACGQGFLDLAATAPDDPALDQHLWRAGLCFANAGSIERAREVAHQLATRLPRSPLAPGVLWRSGLVAMMTGDVVGARDDWQLLAERYPTESEATDALDNVAQLSIVLGELDAAAAAQARYQKRYARVRGFEAALLQLFLAQAYRDAGDLTSARAAYDRAIADRALSHDDMVAARLGRGELVWAQSCPIATRAGLCVRSGTPLTVVARRRAATNAARDFADVIAIANADAPASAALVARARLHQAEAAIERALTMSTVPALATDRGGHPTRAGQRQVGAWLASWTALTGAADNAIDETLAARSPIVSVAAAARAAVMYASLYDTLMAAPPPRATTAEALRYFRDALAVHAAPLEERSRQAAELGLRVAADAGLVTDDVAVCGEILERWTPDAWRAPELRPAAPTTMAPPRDLEAAIADDPTRAP